MNHALSTEIRPRGRDHADVVSALLPHLRRTGQCMPEDLILRLADRLASSWMANNRPLPARVA
jgi:hypothetical protein